MAGMVALDRAKDLTYIRVFSSIDGSPEASAEGENGEQRQNSNSEDGRQDRNLAE